MKILMLISSGRINGNTVRISGLVEERLRQTAARRGESLDIETIFLAQREIRPCRGCRTCFDQGEDHCPLKDDIPAIKAKMKEADGFILASPVYVDDVNGIMKNLIDRLAYICHRPEFAGKHAAFLATTGSTPTGHTLRSMNAAMYWGCRVVVREGFKTGALMKVEDIKARFGERIDTIARRFYADIRGNKSLRPSFLSLMVFKIQQEGWRKKGEPGSLDRRHWELNGWLDRRTQYFFPHDAGRIKVLFARLAGAVLTRIFT